MSNTLTVLSFLLLCLYLALALFWIVRSVLDFINDRETKKHNAKWEEERLQLEKERAAHDAEYHAARMKELEHK